MATMHLAASHSSRQFLSERVRLNFLNGRFDRRNRDAWPAFETLEAIDQALPLTGALTIWAIETGAAHTPRPVFHCEPGWKVQSADFIGDHLALLGADRLALLGPDSEHPVTLIEDRWLAGAHMVRAASATTAWVTCAGADGLLLVDTATREVLVRRPLPSRYGPRYPVTAATDVRRHFIPTDLQGAHVNNIDLDPATGEMLVTLLIPGVVGIFDRHGEWREVAAGFRGLHGARFGPSEDEIYFSDSISGLLCVIDRASGALKRRVDLETRWLHDAVHLGDGLFAAAIGDRNEIRIVDGTTGDVRERLDCTGFGRSVNLLSVVAPPPVWALRLAEVAAGDGAATGARTIEVRSAAPLPGYVLPQIERLVGAASGTGTAVGGLGLRSTTPLGFERLGLLGGGTLAAGSYRLVIDAKLAVGRVSFSLLDESAQSWIVSAAMEPDDDGAEATFTLAEPTLTRLYVCAHNSDRPGAIEVNLFAVRLEAASPDARVLPTPSGRLRQRAAGDTPEREIDGYLLPDVGRLLGARGLVQPVASGLGLRSDLPLRFERMTRLGSGRLAAGSYRLAIEASLRDGRVSFSLLDEACNVWTASAGLEPFDPGIEVLFTLDGDTDTSLYVCAHNSEAPALVDVDVFSATLHALSDGARLIAPGDSEAEDAAAGLGEDGRRAVAMTDFLLPEHAGLLGRAGLVPGVAAGLSLRSAAPLKFERLALLGKGRLEPGRYQLSVRAAERAGSVSLSLLDHASDSWLASTPIAKGPTRLRFEVTAGGLVSLYVCACNIPEAASVDVEIFSVGLERVDVPDGFTEGSDGRASRLELGLAELFTGGSSDEGMLLRRASIEGAYLAIGETLSVEPGRYLLSARVTCDTGEVAIGLQTGEGADWLTTLRFSGTSERDQVEIVVPPCGSMRAVIAAANATPAALRCWIRDLTLVRLPGAG